jgi:hypothetical protein
MKKLLLILLCLPMIGFGQGWSNYYLDANITGNINHNINANINQNIKVTKTIKSIDYGALAIANAERERNRISKQIFKDNKEQRISIEIVNDPVKAFDYGKKFSGRLTSGEAKGGLFSAAGGVADTYEYHKFVLPENFGFISIKKVTFNTPHKFLFNDNGSFYTNISDEGVVTELIPSFPIYNKNNLKIINFNDYKKWEKDTTIIYNTVTKPKFSDYKSSADYSKALRKYNSTKHDKTKRIEPLLDAEDFAKFHNIKIGKVNLYDNDSVFIHKKDIQKAIICGQQGFVGTLIYEDNYQYVIKDIFYAIDKSIGNGVIYKAVIKTYGNKSETTFEELEGRRYYLKRFNFYYISSYFSMYNPKF